MCPLHSIGIGAQQLRVFGVAMEDRITELESRLAFQDHTISELSDVIVKQQQQIDKLTLEIQGLKDRFKATSPSNIRHESEETPPPHY
jgi:SlyX protein